MKLDQHAYQLPAPLAVRNQDSIQISAFCEKSGTDDIQTELPKIPSSPLVHNYEYAYSWKTSVTCEFLVGKCDMVMFKNGTSSKTESVR